MKGEEGPCDVSATGSSCKRANSTSSVDRKQGTQESSSGIVSALSTRLWPEFELVVDGEPPEQVLDAGHGSARSREQSAYLEYMRKVNEGMCTSDVGGVEQASLYPVLLSQ